MNLNRLLFAAVLLVLVLLIVAMLVLSTGTPEGSEGLAVLARILIGAAVVVALLRLARALISRR